MGNGYAKKISDKKIIHQLINFTVKHRRLMQYYLDETGVYQAQHRLLMEIARNPRASQKDLARSMDISAATVAVSLKKLEKGGYIKREVDEKDNRLNKITITEKGNKVVKRSKEIFAAAVGRSCRVQGRREAHPLCSAQKLHANLVRMEDEEKPKRKGYKEMQRGMRRYWKYVKPSPRLHYRAGLYDCGGYREVVMPLLLSKIIDHGVIGGRGVPYIINMGIAMVLTALCMMAGGVGGAFCHQSLWDLPMICGRLFRQIQVFL